MDIMRLISSLKHKAGVGIDMKRWVNFGTSNDFMKVILPSQVDV